jgi:hypothetical protein
MGMLPMLMVAWMVQSILFSWITLWNLCHTFNKCKVVYVHEKRHDSYSMQRRNARKLICMDMLLMLMLMFEWCNLVIFIDNTLKPVSYIEQMKCSLFSWQTSWLLCHAMKECDVAIFHGQTSGVYAYVWMVQGSLFSWITLWNLCHTLDRCKVAYIHGKLHDFYPMQWRNYADYESISLSLYSFTPCANINFIVFDLIRSLIETTIYRTWCEYS